MKRPVLALLLLAACGRHAVKAPPTPSAASAPSLAGSTVMLLPLQDGHVPALPAAAHVAVDRAALDAELAYWIPEGAPRSKWVLPEAIDRALQRSPGLAIEPRSLAVASFQRAQVKRIGDPLFGDLYKLGTVFNSQIAVVPVAAEFIGSPADSAVLHIATAVIDASDGDVLWFGVITGAEKGTGSPAALASAAQAFAQAFAEKKKPGDK